MSNSQSHQQTWDFPFNAKTAVEITRTEFKKKFELHNVLTACPHAVLDPVKCFCCEKELPERRCRKCAVIFCGIPCVGSQNGRVAGQSVGDRQSERVAEMDTPMVSSLVVQDNHNENIESVPHPSSSLVDQTKKVAEQNLSSLNTQYDKENASDSSASSVLSEGKLLMGQINKRLSRGRGKGLNKPPTPTSIAERPVFTPLQVESCLVKSVQNGIDSVSTRQQLPADQVMDHQHEESKEGKSQTRNPKDKATNEVNSVLISSSKTDSQEDSKNETIKAVIDSSKVVEEEISDIIAKSLKCFAEQPPLSTSEDDTFAILHVYSHSFNRIHIMNIKLREDVLDLADEVNDVYMDQPCIERDLKLGDLVIAPYEGNVETMQRAIVEQVEPHYLVRFVDFGKTRRVSKDKLRLLTPELLKISILGYQVKLRGIPDDPPLLLFKDFKGKLKHGMEEQEVTISEIRQLDDNLYEAIVLSEGQDVANKILDLQKWEWEKLYETRLEDDTAINNHDRWSELKVLDVSSNPMFSTIPQAPIKMKLSQFDPNNFELTFKDIQIPDLMREKSVLYRQISRYTNMVQKSNFFPKIDESFLLKLDPELAAGAQTDWIRAVRIDIDEVYCIDTGSCYPVKEHNHEFRSICPEFLKLPAFAIRCLLSDFKKDSKLKEGVLKTFQPGKVYEVTILDFDVKTSCYLVRCNYDVLQQYLSS